jgi:hypothetical protein
MQLLMAKALGDSDFQTVYLMHGLKQYKQKKW